MEPGTDGQTTYRDQDEVRDPLLGTPTGAIGLLPAKKREVEEERFSAALDFFRQEHRLRLSRQQSPSPRPPSPSPFTPPNKKLTPPRSPAPGRAAALGRQMVGASGIRGRSMAGPSPVRAGKFGKTRGPVSTQERDSAEVDRSGGNSGSAVPRTVSVYVPRPPRNSGGSNGSLNSARGRGPGARSSKTPTARSNNRRNMLSPRAASARTYPRGVFFA
ncbi:unnamed protein product [Ascophyllum nodosum]